MEDFKNIFATWHSEKGVSLPDSPEILHAIRRHQRKHIRRMMLIVVLILITIGLFIGIILMNDFGMWTTGAGELLFILFFIYVLWIKYRTFLNKKNMELLSNKKYVEELKNQKINDFRIFPAWQLLALIFWFLAMSLYLYEWLSKSSSRLFIGYSCLLGLSIVIWFVYRPFMKKKYWKRNQIFIDRLETFKKQIK